MLVIDDDFRDRIREAAVQRIRVSRAAGVGEEVIRRSECDLAHQVLGEGELDPNTQEVMLRAVQDAIKFAIEATREPGVN